MVEKAKIIPIYNNIELPWNAIDVMFNPNEYTVLVEANYSNENDKLQFNGTGIKDFSVSLFYDTYEEGYDVRKETNKIISLMKPKLSSSGEIAERPPDCIFVWGGFYYRGVITKADQKFTMFLGNGIPVRATLDLTFQSRELDKKAESLKGLGGGNVGLRRLWMARGGDRLDLIASRILGDPSKWRKIAQANRVYNPIGFPGNIDIGRILIIPK